MLKANGKYIDTLPVQQLFSQEEARADTIVIEVDRFYGAHDLAEFLFIMRGLTPSGGETEAVLTKDVCADVIRLQWEVGPKFTQEAGTLALDLFAYRYEEDADPEEDPPDHLLRYQLPPVQVRALPDGTHMLDERSYTAFLLEVRATAEQALEDIGSAEGEVHSELAAMQDEIDAIPPIVILTQAEYDALPSPDPGTLYVIR